MIEIGPNLLVAIQATCALVGGAVLAYFMYRLVRDC
jgi:hypothetical protein